MVLDVKEQIWLTNVKYLRLLTLHEHYTHVYTASNVIGINTDKNVYKTRNTELFIDDKEHIWLPNA